jgi:adenosylhomocysteine nucleosidase
MVPGERVCVIPRTNLRDLSFRPQWICCSSRSELRKIVRQRTLLLGSKRQVINLIEHKRIAIIAALDREVKPLVKNWPMTTVPHEGRTFAFYESDHVIVVCGGIGAEAARRAAEAVIAIYSPELLISAGVAGALVPELKVGDTIFPATLIDTQDRSRHETAIHDAPVGNTALGRTILASYPEVASVAQKQQLAKSCGAHAVDMEGAAVARAAQVHGIPFLAVKAISDELDFELPEISRFIRSEQFDTTQFLRHIAVRPWLWLRVIRLARNTQIASENLCAWLRNSVLINTIAPRGIAPQKS